jgi:hypothetical protein
VAASMACSSGLGTAGHRAQPMAVYGAPGDLGSGLLLRGEPLIEVAAPTVPSRCDARTSLHLTRVAQSVLPTRGPRGRPRVVEPLMSASEPPELAAPSGDRRVIEVAGGVLVALDRGEFGAGLYHLPSGAAQAEALDSHLSERIHWIGQTRDHIFGVSGLCHGVACDLHQTSVVFEVRLDPVESGEAWRIAPIAVLPGCPESVAIDAAARDHDAAATIATWPTWLGARDIAEVRGVTAPVYFVSFGTLLGRFSAGQSSWFSAPECAQR